MVSVNTDMVLYKCRFILVACIIGASLDSGVDEISTGL